MNERRYFTLKPKLIKNKYFDLRKMKLNMIAKR
jgi:hypothetical protein